MATLPCPKCGKPVEASFQPWQYLVAFFFFPFGLFALVAGRRPGPCTACGSVTPAPAEPASAGESPATPADEQRRPPASNPVADVLGALATGLRAVDRTMRRLDGEAAVHTLESVTGHLRREDPGGTQIILQRSGPLGLWTWVFHNGGLIPIFLATGVLSWWLPTHGVELGMKVDAGLIWFLRGACALSTLGWVLGLFFGAGWSGSRRVSIDRMGRSLEIYEPPRRRTLMYGTREQATLDFIGRGDSSSEGERWRPAVVLDDAGTRRVVVASRFTYGFQADAQAAGEVMLRELRALL